MRRKEHGECGPALALLGTASDANAAAVLLHDAFADPQPQSSTNVLFRGHEWLEDLAPDLLRNPTTVIEHGQPNAGRYVLVPLHVLADSNPDLAAILDGVDTVADQVRHQLTNLPRNRANFRIRFNLRP